MKCSGIHDEKIPEVESQWKGAFFDPTAALTSGESGEAHEGFVCKKPVENLLVGGVLGKNVGALGSGPYGYPTGEGGELTPSVSFLFFGELAERPTRLDFLGGLLMDAHPIGIGGSAGQDCDNSPLLVAEGRRCAGALR